MVFEIGTGQPQPLEGIPAPSLAEQLADDMVEGAIDVFDKGYVAWSRGLLHGHVVHLV